MPFNRPISDNLQPSNEICLNTDKLLLENNLYNIKISLEIGDKVYFPFSTEMNNKH